MPLYEFSCGQCGTFSTWRTIAARDDSAPCPHCGVAARRCLGIPMLRVLSSSARAAHAINERSCHEPAVRRTHRCSSGCGCGPKSSASTAVKPRKRPKRPWMLGH